MEKSGCGLIVGLLMAGVIGMGLIYTCGSNGQGAGGPEGIEGNSAIATVGEYVVTPALLNQILEQQNASTSDASPLSEVFRNGQALYAVVNESVMSELAQKYGVTLSDEQIIQAELKALDAQIMQAKSGLIAQGKLKPNATDAEFEAEFKKISGRGIAEIKQEIKEKLATALTDATKRAQIVAGKLREPIQQKIAATINPTEDEIRGHFRTFSVKRILFGTSSPTNKATAEAVLKKLRSGSSFEEAMETHSKDQPLTGKKLSASTTDIPATMVDAIPAYSPIKKLKPGGITAVLDQPEGLLVYKLVKIDEKLPKDYIASKSTYRKGVVDSRASQQFAKEAQEIAASDTVKWSSQGFKLLYGYLAQKMSPPPNETPEKSKERLRQLAKEAKTASTTDPLGGRMAGLLHYAAIDELWKSASPQEKEALKAGRLESMESALESTESIALRIELADLLIELGKSAEAIEQLTAAARANNDYELNGPQDYAQIQSRIVKMAQLKLITDQERKELEVEQARWVKDKVEYAKEQTELKKQQAEDAKRAEQDRKALESEKKGSGAVVPTERGKANPSTTGK